MPLTRTAATKLSWALKSQSRKPLTVQTLQAAVDDWILRNADGRLLQGFVVIERHIADTAELARDIQRTALAPPLKRPLAVEPA